MNPFQLVPKSGQFTRGGGGDDTMARIARLESDVAHIQSDIHEIKGEIVRVRTGLDSAKFWILGIFGAGFIILIGALATGYLRLSDRNEKLFDAISDMRVQIQHVVDVVTSKKR